MTSITQTIPGFTSGISQQPDELMLPGQVKDLVNGLPDITEGLVKRSGSKRLALLPNATTHGTWFSYYRDKSEGAYIGQVQTNGQVNIWRADDGTAVTVNGNATSYLSHSGANKLKFLTVADTTFVTNVDKVVAMTNATSPARSPQYQAYVELRSIQHGREYSFSCTTPNGPETTMTGNGEGRVTSIEVEKPDGGSNNGDYIEINRGGGTQGISPDCRHQGTEIFIENSGSGKHLAFRLTATCQVAVRDNMGSDSIEGDDYVGIYNATAELLNGGYGWRPYDGSQSTDNTVEVTLADADYKIRVKTVQEIRMRKNRGFFRPEPSSFDANVDVSADTILTQAKSTSDGGTIALDTVQKIGNGIFLGHSSPFVVETANPDLWRITSMEVNDPSELPRQCRDGYIVKVANSADSNEDDYYLEFVGDNGGDGTGHWEECLAPSTKTTLNAATLPIQIQRQANGTFQISTPPWVQREVGDDDTNPIPSIVGNKISQTFFHRNRLGFLSEDNVVLSQAGDVYNFFQDSALVIAANDPIDIQASSTQPTRFIDSIETNTGLVIFSETQQFLLHTDSDTLTPDTGKLTNISTYRYSPNSSPVSLGTTIGFLDSAGANGRFFEMFDIRREGEPQVIDQTKIVPTLLEDDTDIVINSRENNTIFFCKSGTKLVHGYRYYNVGSKRVQSAWFTWRLPFDIEYAFVLDDQLLLVSFNGYLLEINLQDKSTTPFVPGSDFYGDSTTYEAYLDSFDTISSGTYDSSTGLTTFNWFGTGSGTVAVVDSTNGDTWIAKSSDGTTHTFSADLSGQTLFIGYLFEMKVDLPKIYVKTKAAEKTTSDVTAALSLQRANLRFGDVGQVSAVLKRRGKPDYTVSYDSTAADWYTEDEIPAISEKTIQVPIYERNHNVNISLKSNHPGPASFHSMTWEGDYTPMYHKRV